MRLHGTARSHDRRNDDCILELVPVAEERIAGKPAWPARCRCLAAFGAAFPKARKLLVGGDGIVVEEFLERPVEHWVKP